MMKIFFLIIFCFNSAFAALPTVFLDPGHGGKHIGARSQRFSYEEKALTLKLAKMIQAKLKKRGIRSQLSRSSDVFLSLPERAKKANTSKAALFVSLHFNSAPSKDIQGIEIFYSPHASKNSERLAALILEEALKNTSAQSRGIKEARFTVLQETQMPAVLVEGGFLSHPIERKNILDKKYLERLSEGIANGLTLFMKKHVPGAS